MPGLHLIDSLVEEGQIPASILWLQAGRAVEREVLSGLEERAGGAHCQRVLLPLEGSGGGAPSKPGLALRMPRAIQRARRALQESGTEVLLGLGGYTTAPAVLAARSLGIKSALLEINAASGLATRTLTPFASRVLHAWRSTLPGGRPKGRHRLVGPPVAPRFHARSEETQREARRRLGIDAEVPLLVVLGGSQGAGGLNSFLRSYLPLLIGEGVEVLHQVGPGRLEEAAEPIEGYTAVEYVHDVPTALEAASLVLCRGGASTLAEIAATRAPAVVVPYPHHSDRHQERNAGQLDTGVRIVQEEDLRAPFASELAVLTGSEGLREREKMERVLANLAPEGAARRLAHELATLAPLSKPVSTTRA